MRTVLLLFLVALCSAGAVKQQPKHGQQAHHKTQHQGTERHPNQAHQPQHQARSDALHKQEANIEQDAHICHCKVVSADRKLTEDLGLVKKYPRLPKHQQKMAKKKEKKAGRTSRTRFHPAREDPACRALTHQCRRLCHQKARRTFDLNQKLGQQGHGKAGRRGYSLCLRYNQVTHRPLRFSVTSRSARCHGDDVTPLTYVGAPWARARLQLCCGHTALPGNGGHTYRVFGWNPDCRAQNYVVGP